MNYSVDELALIERARAILNRRDDRMRKERHAREAAKYRAGAKGQESMRRRRARRREAVAAMQAAREHEYQIRGWIQGPLMHTVPILDIEGLNELAAVL